MLASAGCAARTAGQTPEPVPARTLPPRSAAAPGAVAASRGTASKSPNPLRLDSARVALPRDTPTARNDDLHRNEPPLDTAQKDLVFRIEPPRFTEVLSSRIALATNETCDARAVAKNDGTHAPDIAHLRIDAEISLGGSEIRNRGEGACGRSHDRSVVNQQGIARPSTDGLQRNLRWTDTAQDAVARMRSRARVYYVQGQNVMSRSSAGLPSDGPVAPQPEPERLQHCAVEPLQRSLQAMLLPQLSLTTDASGQLGASTAHRWSPHVAPATRSATLYPPRKP